MASQDDPVRIPARYSRVDPWVISSDTAAEIVFLTTAFGATETPGSRMIGADGRIGHVEVEVGDAVIMLFDAGPDWPPLPSHLRIYTADAEDAFDRAVEAGARPITRPTDLAFGERVARVRDPQGHVWWIHQRLEDVAPDDVMARLADASAQEAMSYVESSLADDLSKGP
jgi:PhnB protein